jgi:molecular chaperone GrpE
MAKSKKIKVHTPGEETVTEDKIDQKDDSIQKDTEDKVETVDPIKALEEKLGAVEQEAKENYDRWLRVSAEFENYQKRAAREMNDFRKFANERFVTAMLPVVDNLDRAIESSNNDEHADRSMLEGVNMTLKEILKVFEQFNVKPFESLGKTFDPSLHQAIMQEETEGHPENSVVKELQKGYMMHDRLLRPAMVVVSKTKTKPEHQNNNKEEKKETEK